MRLSQLKALISEHAADNKDSEIKSLAQYVNATIVTGKHGVTLGERKDYDPDVSVEDYLKYAGEKNIGASEPFIIPTEEYLKSHSSGAKVFLEWEATDNKLAAIAAAEQKEAKPYKEKLNQWLTNEKAPLNLLLNESQFRNTYNEQASLEVLTKKLDELASQKKDPLQEQKIKYITLSIGYQNAARTIEDYAAVKARHPEAKIDIYMLKRHEVSKNVHKGFGFNKDTGLTAVDASVLTKQTVNDLQISQMVHSAYAEALKATSLISYVKQHISPIRRAWQTAMKAVFTKNIANETEVNSVFVETKHGTLARKFARSSATSSKKKGLPPILEELKTLDNVKINANAFDEIKSDTASQNTRVGQAVDKFFLAPPTHSTPGSTLNVLVAHGGVIEDMVRKMDKQHDSVSTIPPGKVKMDYGDFKTVFKATDSKGHILEVSGGGTFTRSGIERSALMQVSEFKKQTNPKKSSKIPNELIDIQNTLDKCHPSKKQKKWNPFTKRGDRQPNTIEDRRDALYKLENQVNAALKNPALASHKPVMEKLKEQITYMESLKSMKTQTTSPLAKAAAEATLEAPRVAR